MIGGRKPRADLTLVIHRRDSKTVETPVCRLDTAEEVSIYEAGGVLQRFAQDFLEVAEVVAKASVSSPHRASRSRYLRRGARDRRRCRPRRRWRRAGASPHPRPARPCPRMEIPSGKR